MYVSQQKANLALQLHASCNKLKSWGRGIYKHYIIMKGKKLPIQEECFYSSRDQCVTLIVIKGNKMVVRLRLLKTFEGNVFFLWLLDYEFMLHCLMPLKHISNKKKPQNSVRAELMNAVCSLQETWQGSSPDHMTSQTHYQSNTDRVQLNIHVLFVKPMYRQLPANKWK